MTTVAFKSFLFGATALLAILNGPVWAQSNTNTTIQQGQVNINRTFQCGDTNDNATYQSGRININHTVQRCGNNRNQTAQFGGINTNRTEQESRGRQIPHTRAGQLHPNHGRSKR